jgi:Flp pilus assembly protein TadD
MISLNFAARLENALCSYFVYAWKAIWPSGLAPFYPIASDPIALWKPILAVVFLLVVSALVWRGGRAHPYLLAGWLWFLGTLIPVIGLVQVGAQARADRYTYIPLIGLFVIFVWGLADLAEVRRLSLAPRVVLGSAVLALLSILSVRQLSFWNSSYELWTHTLAITSNNPVAEHNLAMELMRTRRWEEATPHLEKAKEINPTDAVSLVDLGAALAAQGRDKEAVQQYETAVQRSSDPRILVAAHQNLGYEYRKLGAEDKAETNYRQALSIDPRQMSAMEGLGQVLMNRQINEMSQSLETRPTAEGFLRYGRMLQQANRRDEARTAFENALKLDPNLREARSALDALPAQLDTK